MTASPPHQAPSSFQHRLVAYIDILGWSAITNRGEEQRIREAIASIESTHSDDLAARARSSQHGYSVGESAMQSSFSDTVVYSCSAKPDDIAWLIFKAQVLCGRLLRMGHCTRGALCFGELEHTPSLIAGRALVEAHGLERDVAKYPRVIVADEAARLLESVVPSTSPWLARPLQLQQDLDGLFFLDIYGFLAGRLRLPEDRLNAPAVLERIRNELRQTAGPNVRDRVEAMNHRAKHGWMIRYLEAFLGDPEATLLNRA